MTVTQSFRRNWTTRSGDSDSKYFERRCGRPPRTPIVNVWWEPFAGSVWILSSHSARSICASSSRTVIHYNQGRPHSSLGRGIPDPQKLMPQARDRRHQLPADCRIRSRGVLGGLHHEYWLEKVAA